ncbi:Peptidyl-tRNA hydrolase, PTH2 [Sesbania bispinosa]|nr:Peptidyl-tRNA hydrolase, PTH2 [Sesbania bispinosa]
MFPSFLKSGQPQEQVGLCLSLSFFMFQQAPLLLTVTSRIAKQQQHKQKGEWLAGSFKPENFVPGLVIGFIFGLLLDLSKPHRNHLSKKVFSSSKVQQQLSVSSNGDQELKMELLSLDAEKFVISMRPTSMTLLLNRNKLKEAAESIGLPTFVVADAGRTQVSAGSKTVLAVGPGPKASVDSVTGRRETIVPYSL